MSIMNQRIVAGLTCILIILSLAEAAFTGSLRQEEIKPANSLMVLFTDFGRGGYQVSELKGMIYSANIEARVVDGTHEITPFDIREGAFLLYLAAKDFPDNVVFIGIVDPGDPLSERRIVVTTGKGQIFVGPDNGLFTYVIRNFEIESVHQITNQDMFAKPVSSSLISPIVGRAGALVASGYAVKDVGPPVDDPHTFDVEDAMIVASKMEGEIVLIDHFGNCVTNIPGNMAEEFGLELGDEVIISVGGGVKVEAMFGRTYGDVPQGKPVVFVNSLDLMELAINMEDFANSYSISTGMKTEIEARR